MSTQGIRDFRTSMHYTPPKGWINDPNGLVYVNGEWHLFAQHYPHAGVWGPMHWIHAVSTDLLHWTDKGVAIYPDEELGMIFSGSAVIDKGNTSGLGKPGSDPMVCMFTHHGKHEQQSLAYSDDYVHFTKYTGNPVMPNAELRDYRDPKVILNPMTGSWTVVIAAGDHVEFNASDDLIHWRKTGEFGRTENLLGGVFECPDLFPLIAPDGREVWVLSASMALPRETGGSRTQYFLGEFDGNTFIETLEKGSIKLVDFGFDNYAAVTFFGTNDVQTDAPAGIPAGCYMLGWGNDWNYADDEPTGDFCGQTTYARKLSLIKTNVGLRLASEPVTPTFKLAPVSAPASSDGSSLPVTEAALPGELFRLHIEADGPFAATLLNDNGEEFRFGLDGERCFYSDRTASSHSHFSAYFDSGLMSVVKTPRFYNGHVTLDLYFDKCLSETFADNGAYVNSTLVYPDAPYNRVRAAGNVKLSIG